MQRKEIIFTIGKDGDIHSTIKGIAGAGCRSQVEKLKSLGAIEAEARTDDYYKGKPAEIRIHQVRDRQ